MVSIAVRLKCLFILIICFASKAHAQDNLIALVESKTEFLGRYPSASLLNFDNYAPGAFAPLIAVPLQITGVPQQNSAQVVNSLVGQGHSFFFASFGSAPNWLMPNGRIQLQWVPDVFGNGVEAVGFDLNCFACDAPSNPSLIKVEVLNAAGTVLARKEFPVQLNSQPRFFGVRISPSLKAARIQIAREGVKTGILSYLIDDLRYQYQTSLFRSSFEDFDK